MPRKVSAKPVVTLREAAEMFGLRPDTLRHAVLVGRVQALKSGKVWLIKPSTVRTAILQGKLRKGRIPEAGET